MQQQNCSIEETDFGILLIQAFWRLSVSYKTALARISGLVKAKRREKKLGLRAVASESGVSASTLSRLERGIATSLPDADTLTKLANWLEVSVSFLLSEENELTSSNVPKLNTPEIVEVHLRADKNLTPETATALAELFRVAYEQFTKNQSE